MVLHKIMLFQIISVSVFCLSLIRKNKNKDSEILQQQTRNIYDTKNMDYAQRKSKEHTVVLKTEGELILLIVNVRAS